MTIAVFLICLLPYTCFAQTNDRSGSSIKATIISDSGKVKGNFVYATDTTVVISQMKNSTYQYYNIPVNSIKELQLKHKGEGWGLTAGVGVLGFVLAAGLIQNNDYDNNGKTSFLELVFSAIEGSTSRNRQRRNAALIAGAAGATGFMAASLLTRKKLSLSFPLNNRNYYYAKKRAALNKFTNF